MKEGWRNVAIKDIAKTGAGGTPLRSQKEFYEEGSIPWLMSGEVCRRDIVSTANFITHLGLEKSSAKIFPKGTVLVAMYGATAGQVGVLRIEAASNQAVCGVYPSNNHVPEFLYYYLTYSKMQLVAQAVGNAQPNISQAKIRNTVIPLPSLEEQKRIVAILDEAFEGLARARKNAEYNLESVREFFERAHRDALSAGLGDKQVALSEVAEITSSLVDPRKHEFCDLPHVGAGNMAAASDRLVDVRTAKEEGLISGKYLFDEGMVLYSKIRPYLRKACRPDFAGLCSADVYPVLPKVGLLDRDYLFHLLIGTDFTEYAIKGSDRAGMPKVNREHMFRYKFSLPRLEDQKSVASKLDQLMCDVFAMIASYDAKIRELEHLQQSLLHKAFSGELS